MNDVNMAYDVSVVYKKVGHTMIRWICYFVLLYICYYIYIKEVFLIKNFKRELNTKYDKIKPTDPERYVS